jgi:hypothetical protein
MAQLVGEANRAFDFQARAHAEAAERLQQEASAGREEIASYLPAKGTVEQQTLEQWFTARDTIAEMNRAGAIRVSEVGRLRHALQAMLASIAQNEAGQVGTSLAPTRRACSRCS